MEVSLLKTAACVAASTSPFVEALKTLTEATHPLLTALDSVGRCVVPHRETSVAELLLLILVATHL